MSNENLLWMALASVHSCRFCMYCAKIDNASRDNTNTSGQLSPTNGEWKFSYYVSGLINSRLKCTFSILIPYYDYWIITRCGRVVRDFEREAKTRCNF